MCTHSGYSYKDPGFGVAAMPPFLLDPVVETLSEAIETVGGWVSEGGPASTGGGGECAFRWKGISCTFSYGLSFLNTQLKNIIISNYIWIYVQITDTGGKTHLYILAPHHTCIFNDRGGGGKAKLHTYLLHTYTNRHTTNIRKEQFC